MKITIESSSPDGMTVTFETYIMTWTELKKLIDVIANIESGGLRK
jgi:hypothetical protein